MKSFLGYLTFVALLALCYVEKINAEAAKTRVRGSSGKHIARHHAPVWTGQPVTAVHLKQ